MKGRRERWWVEGGGWRVEGGGWGGGGGGWGVEGGGWRIGMAWHCVAWRDVA